MPFLYDVWNVKLQLYAKGLVWSRGGGGEHLNKTFSIFYMLNSKKRSFQPIFFNWYLSNEKTAFVDKSRVEPTIFFIEKISFSWNFSLVIFMGNPSLRLSEVLKKIDVKMNKTEHLARLCKFDIIFAPLCPCFTEMCWFWITFVNGCQNCPETFAGNTYAQLHYHG